MLQKIIVALNIIGLIAITYLLFDRFQNNKEIVYIDTPRLLSQYKAMEEVQKKLEQKEMIYKSKVDTLAMELQADMKKYERTRASLGPKEMKLSEELLRNKQQQAMQYQQNMQQKASEEREKLQNKVIQDANEFIKAYAEKKKYKFILAATSMGNLIYAEKTFDMTDQVLSALNENYLKEKGIR